MGTCRCTASRDRTLMVTRSGNAAPEVVRRVPEISTAGLPRLGSTCWLAAMAGDAGAAGRAHGYRLLPHCLQLPLRLCLAALRGHLGVVWDGHGAGADSAARADDLCAGGGGSAAGTDLIFPG